MLRGSIQVVIYGQIKQHQQISLVNIVIINDKYEIINMAIFFIIHKGGVRYANTKYSKWFEIR